MFDDLYNNSVIPSVLKESRGLIKEECRAIFEYMLECKPITILEFGTQYGCSSRAFVEISKWVGTDVRLHSWDISNQVKNGVIGKDEFTFHLEDVTGKESEVLEKYKPDLVYLDAHPYKMTKKLMEECIDRKIDFMAHDVEFCMIERARKWTDNFTNFSEYADWEPFILSEVISEKLLEEDAYEDDDLEVDCIRGFGGCGLAIVKMKGSE